MPDSKPLKKLKRSELEEIIKELNESLHSEQNWLQLENTKNSLIEDILINSSSNKFISKFFEGLCIKDTSTIRLVYIKNDYFLEKKNFSSGKCCEDFALLDGQVIEQIGEKSHLVIEDTSRIHNIRFSQGHKYPRSLIAFPILWNNEKIAVVWVGDLNYQAFSKIEFEKYKKVIDLYRGALAALIKYERFDQERNVLGQIVAEDKLPAIILNNKHKILYANELAVDQFDITLNDREEYFSNNIDFSDYPELSETSEKPNLKYKEKEFEVITSGISENSKVKAIYLKFIDKTFEIAKGKYLNTIISTLTHYLKSPLIEIKELTSLISAIGDLSGKQIELLSKMQEKVEEIEMSISQLLSVNKIDHGNFIKLSKFSMDAIVEKVSKIFYPLTQQKQITINFLKSEKGQLINDENLIKHALLNILEYAIRETHIGGTIEIQHKIMSGKHSITISDSGKGISSFDVKKIMEESNMDQKRNELNITRDIMSVLNGDLLIESNLGSGTIITLVFPQ